MQNDSVINFVQNIKIDIKRNSVSPLLLPLYGARGCVHPDVLYFPEGERGYRFWLYYTPYPPQDKEFPVLVRSNDGINFTDRLVDNPLLMPSRWGWDSEYLADQDVIRIAPDRWIMYYAGNHKIQQIGAAISSDGIEWKKIRANPIISKKMWEKYTGLKLAKNIRCPAAIWDSVNKKVYLYFTARHDGIEEVFMGVSYDGINFKINPEAALKVGGHGDFDAGAIHHVDVVQYKDFAVLIYVGSPKCYSSEAPYALGMAISSDKVKWHKISQNPFLRPVKEYEANRLYRATLCAYGDSARLYYSVNDSTAGISNISLATIRFY